MDHDEYAYTQELDPSEIDTRLRSTDTGVLALASSNDAYAIPVAHYYDGEAVYFRLGRTETSTKQRFLDSTATACYVVYGTTPTADSDELQSWSIHVTGPIQELLAQETARFDAASINRHFLPIRIFDEAIEDVEIRLWRLDIDSLTGRATLAA